MRGKCGVLITLISLLFGSLSPALAERVVKKESKEVKANLDSLERLNFGTDNQKKDMGLFKKLHFPDGRTTVGIEDHLRDLAGLFNGKPDSRITSHPIAFGSGSWTATIGVLEASFSEPLKLADGNELPPTGKKVNMPMAIIAKWKKGCMIEKHLFWDTTEYNRQIGLTPVSTSSEVKD